MAKICFITAIYGNYETCCKRFAAQTVDTDFVCFTDNATIVSNGWKIDTTPYHITHKSPMDDNMRTNSLCNNTHTFNIAKYYKQAFVNIPTLAQYEVIVWVDGTIEITYDKASEYIMTHIYRVQIIGWHHEYRYGRLGDEVAASHMCDRYSSTRWNNQSQPYQDVDAQYSAYVEDGYTDAFYTERNAHTPHMGVWVTCFVAFLHKHDAIKAFLDAWYLQTLTYTTQDQIGFSYVCQKTAIVPFTLPNAEIGGFSPHTATLFYKKHGHGAPDGPIDSDSTVFERLDIQAAELRELRTLIAHQTGLIETILARVDDARSVCSERLGDPVHVGSPCQER